MLLTYLGVLFALAAILALVAVAGRAAKRLGMGGAGRPDAPMAVLERAAVGPRQGVALVRVGSQLVLVSVGDGGVRPLMRMMDDEAAKVIAQYAPPADPQVLALPRGGAAIFKQALAQSLGLKGAARRAGAVALLLLAGAAALGAQAAPAAPAAAARATPPASAPITAATPGNTAVGPAQGVPRDPAATAASVVERLAPTMDLRVGGDGRQDGLRLNGSVGVVLMLGLMSMLPTLVLMTTGFTRILVVLYFLRQALGTQTSPPAPLIAGLALILTGFVMAPTMSRVNQEAITPWLDGKIEQVEMLERGAQPLREFMLRQTRPADVRRMVRLSRQPAVAGQPVPFVTLMAAFTISELRTAFAIGFALFLPFIVIDVVVASVLMSLGMFMLPPTMIALPFKLLLFVLVDGWGLITQSLVAGFR